mgnify:CR=1 FL=1
MTPLVDNSTVRDNTDPICRENGAETLVDHDQDTLVALGF